MATRKVPVTSVTPASKVKATSNAQQSRTRNLVIGIATATPVGRLATGAIKASRTTGIAGFGATKIAIKKVANETSKSKKPFSVPSNAHPKLHDKVSSNVKTVPSAAMKKSNAPFSSTSGAKQAKAENARLKSKPSKAETKANARGLKAANKPLSKGNKKLVTQIKQQTGYIAMDRRPTPPTVAAALKKGSKGSFITEAKKIAMQEARSEGPAKKISAAQKMLNDKAALRRNLNK